MWKNSMIKFGFPINNVHHLRHMNNCASDSVSNERKIPIKSLYYWGTLHKNSYWISRLYSYYLLLCEYSDIVLTWKRNHHYSDMSIIEFQFCTSKTRILCCRNTEKTIKVLLLPSSDFVSQYISELFN